MWVRTFDTIDGEIGSKLHEGSAQVPVATEGPRGATKTIIGCPESTKRLAQRERNRCSGYVIAARDIE
jgi:hypothetical protein